MNAKIKFYNLKNIYTLHKNDIIQISVFIFIMAIILVIIPNCVFQLSQVISGSMSNTIQADDYILINKVSYKFNSKPARCDVIDFISPDERERYVKRIIGLPGETIFIKDGVIFINNVPLNEDYTIPLTEETCSPITIPENEYYVMGDNRPDSTDSRYWKCKFVKENDIKGKVISSFNIKEIRAAFY